MILLQCYIKDILLYLQKKSKIVSVMHYKTSRNDKGKEGVYKDKLLN